MMINCIILMLVAGIALPQQASCRHPFALGNVRSFLPRTLEESYLYGISPQNLESAFQNSDQPKASPSRRKFIIDTSEMKKDDPVEVAGVAEQTNPELEQEEDFNPSDYYKYSIMKKQRKALALQKLFEEIAERFPFLANQGLLDTSSPQSIDHLLSMTIFSQPKIGKK